MQRPHIRKTYVQSEAAYVVSGNLYMNDFLHTPHSWDIFLAWIRMWSLKLSLLINVFFTHITHESVSRVYSHMRPKIGGRREWLPADVAEAHLRCWFTGGYVDPLAAVVHRWKR